MHLQGKNALVTGASRGIGRAIVERLARDGAAVAIGYVDRRVDADEVVRSVVASGRRAVAVQADVGRPSAATALFSAAEEQLGPVDILVNNAGTNVPTPTVAATTDEAYDAMMRVNAYGTFALLREASGRMRDGGRIVNVSSAQTAVPAPGAAVYAASKAAVDQFTAVVARELGPRGITVNAVSPGATDTETVRAAVPPELLRTTIPAVTPLRRLGTPEDVADAVAFLCGVDARWVTGQNLRLTGGFV